MWTPNERSTLKSQLQAIQADLAATRANYPVRAWDPTNAEKCLIGDRLDTISNTLARIIDSCDDPSKCTEEKL